jgi:hypothetical protein
MECKIDENKLKCNCSYKNCIRKGVCCDCLKHHIKKRQLPACFFPKNVEKTYDRSYEKFAELVNQKKI